MFGARPLKRFLQRELETRIARALLSGDIADGSQIEVDVDDGEWVVKSEKQPHKNADERR